VVFEGRNRGVINYPDDFDYFRFPSSAGELFAVEVELGTLPDTVIFLFDRNGTFLGDNDDFERLGRGSRIEYQAQYDGDYFVNVQSLNQDSDTGSYGLFLTYLGTEPLDDHGSTIETATNIDEGRIPGDIEVSSDSDYFRIFAAANTFYVAQVNTRTHPNVRLVLFNRNGGLIKEGAKTDDLGGGSRLIWRTPPIETEYILAVGSMRPEFDTGTYMLMVTPIPDQHGDSISTATPINSPKNVGFIEPSDYLDYFRFSAQRGDTYVIEVVLDGHPDTVLTMYQARGLQVKQNDDDEGMEGGSRIVWTAPSTGVYFLEVKSFDQSSQIGAYALILDRSSAPSPTATPAIRVRPTPAPPATRPTPTPLLVEGIVPRTFATNFLARAIEGEILSLLNLDSAYSTPYYRAEPLASVEASVKNLTSLGQYATAGFDWDYWVLPDVRVISGTRIEVDSCEKWTTSYYESGTDTFLGSEPTDRVPQTITMERLTSGWYVTEIEFFTWPHFCP
jgi:hypothetical protein